MLIFTDTELTDFIHGGLISIGLVAEDGREFYTECNEVDLSLCSDVVREALLPKLGG
jgi:hypothetical protein